MSNCEYVRINYKVPATIGRNVIVDGKRGTIVNDMGNYIGVKFYCDKLGIVFPCHPTWKVEYLEEEKEDNQCPTLSGE